MPHDNSRLITLLEKRLGALEALAAEITAGQQACIDLDLAALAASDQRKESLCEEIRSLDLELSALRHDRESHSAESRPAADPEIVSRIERLCRSSEEARSEARRRNAVYVQFLARSRATLSVMANVISYCLGVYGAPGLDGRARIPFYRGY